VIIFQCGFLSQTEKMSVFQTLKHFFHLKNYIQINVAKAKTIDSGILATAKNFRMEKRGPLVLSTYFTYSLSKFYYYFTQY